MLGPHDLKVGTLFVMDGDPWQVVEAHFVKMAQRTGHVEAKVKNLRTGVVLGRSFKQYDEFTEADVGKVKVVFLYTHRGSYIFSEERNPKARFELNEQHLGDDRFYLTPNLVVEALRFDDEIIGIALPPKVNLKVAEAPPWVKGDTATGGAKTVTTETGLKVRTPHFIEEGSIIRVNTKTGEYTERVEK